MHLTGWPVADPRFSISLLLEKCARNRGQGDRGAERRAAGACAWSLRGRCSGVGEHQVCVGRSRRVCPQSLCAGRGCRKCFGARAASRGRSEEGCVRELFARSASPGPGVQRSCPPPPAPSARPAPTSASRLFLVPGSQGRRSPGNPAGTAPPGRRCSLPRPRRRLSGAHPASQRGAGAAGRGNAGWAQVQRTGPPQHGNVGCPPPPAPSSPTRQSPFREFFASCLLRRGWGRGRGRSFSISLVPSRCQPPVSKSLTLPSTYGRVNNYLALGIGSAAPGGQSLQPGKTTTSGGGERREAFGWPWVSGSSLVSSPPLSAAPQTASGALGIFSVVTWAAALRAFLESESASAAPFSQASQQPHQLQAPTWPCLAR